MSDESAWSCVNAKIQQLVDRVTRLEEMIMGAVVHASDPPPQPDPPAPSPLAAPPPANR
jgi:hypothetical protein